MRPFGPPELLAYVRRLAVTRFLQGQSPEDIAEFVGVRPRSVWRWIAAFRQAGWSGLEPLTVPGRPARLDARQQREVLSWIDRNAEDFAFVGSRWTARRIAWVIATRWGIRFNRRYLNAWLKRRAITPQKPASQPRQKDPQAIARWLQQDWPRIKKTP